MEIQLNTHEWLKLPMDTRGRLREIFSIPKSKGAIVESDKVISDGTTYEDLSVVTIDKMRKYMSENYVVEDRELEEMDFVSLFNALVKQIELDKELESPEVEVVDQKQIMIDSWVRTIMHLKGQAAEMGLEVELENTVFTVFNLGRPIPQLTPTKNAEPKTPAKAVRKKAKAKQKRAA